MAMLNVELRTGGDDLRGGSWGNLTVKLAGQHGLIRFEKFTGTKGLSGNSSAIRSIDVPGLDDPNQVEFFQIEHASQEGFGQTRDNWNLDNVKFIMQFGRFPLVLAEHGFHRFTGRTATLTVFPPKS